MLLLLCFCYCSCIVAAAANNGGGNNPNNNRFPNGNGNNPNEQFSLSQHVSFNPLDDSMSLSAETEAQIFYQEQKDNGNDTNQNQNEKSKIDADLGENREEEEVLSLSLFSSDALACNGGDSTKSFVAMAECNFRAAVDIDGDKKNNDGEEDDDEEESEDEESDDDDDDDDDGHSSMLSNASVRRSVAATGGDDDSGGSASSYSKHSSSSNSSNGYYNRNAPSSWGGGSSAQKTNQMMMNHKTNCRTSTSFLSTSLSTPPSSTKRLLQKVPRGGGGALIADGSEFAKRLLVAALVTLMYEAVLGHLLEFLKIVMQTSPAGTTYGDVPRDITSEKGMVGIWDGFVPWGVVQSVFKGGVFGLAHAISSSLLLPLVEKEVLPKQLALTLAGGIAGGFQGYVLSPTLLLKTRVMTNPVFREAMSMWRTTLLSFRIGFDVVAQEGLGALMKGANVFATKRVFDWATRFYFSDVAEAFLLKQSAFSTLSNMEKIGASLLGGTASTLTTLPLDVLVAKTQDAKKAGVKVSPFTMLRDELKEHGWSGLRDSYMRGFEARLAHVCFTTVAMKTGTAFLYDALYGKK